MALGTLTASKRIRKTPTSGGGPGPGPEPTVFVYPFVSASSPSANEHGGYDRSPYIFYWTTNSVTWSWRIGGGYSPGTTKTYVDAWQAGTQPWPHARLLVDNTPVTGWQAPSNTTSGIYTFAFTASNGHHIASVEFQSQDPDVFVGDNQVFARDFVVNTTGAPLPQQVPWTAVMRFERDQEGHLPAYWVQVPYPGSPPTPYTRPLKARFIENHNAVLPLSDYWVRSLTFNQWHFLKREFVLGPTGDVFVSYEQKDDYGSYTGASVGLNPPRITQRDGPRYVGTLGPVQKINVRRGDNGFYMTETTGRLCQMSVEGEVETIVGWRVVPGQLKGHTGLTNLVLQYGSEPTKSDNRAFYDGRWEFVGDWSQVSTLINPRRFSELRGFAVARRRADNSIDTYDGREFWLCDRMHHRILYVNARTMDSVDDYEQPHFPPSGYEAPASPTGEAQVFIFAHGDTNQTFLNGPMDCRVSPFDGKLYWVNCQGGSICRANLDGSGFEVVLQGVNNPTDAELDIIGTTGNKSRLSTDTIRANWLEDGGPGVATCCRPQALDFASDGELYWAERYTFAVRKINLTTRLVTTVIQLPIDNQGAFGLYDITMHMDREGTCGPVDDIFTEIYRNNNRRHSKTGTFRGTWHSGGAIGYANNGPVEQCATTSYIMGFGVGNGRICVAGNSAGFQFKEITKKQPTDPTFDAATFKRGHDAYMRGNSSYSNPRELPMILRHGAFGQGELGYPTFEEMGTWDDQSIRVYGLQNGIPAGSEDDFLYFVRWCVHDRQYELQPAKFAALQHDNVTWLTDSARRATVAGYDLVMLGIYNGVANVQSNLNAIRTINPGIEMSMYVQILEGRCRGVYMVEFISGMTYRVHLDGPNEVNSGVSTSVSGVVDGTTVQLRNCANPAFNGNWTKSSITVIDGRNTFTISVPGGPYATETNSTGSCITTNQAHAPRVLIIQENGGPKGWWLRGTVNGVPDRILWSGVDGSQRAVNITNCVTFDGNGDSYPPPKAAYDKAAFIAPYQPTIGAPLMVWIDNWNYRPRISNGVWGTTVGGPVSGGAIANTDAGLQSRFRTASKTYVDAIRAENPDVRIIGNADGVSGAAPAGIQSLNWPEWPVGTLDGAFIENLYGPDDVSPFGEDLNTMGSFYVNDNGAKVQGRIREQRARLADPGLHIVMVRGRGATNAEQQADYQFFVAGLTAILMQGTSRKNQSYYAFGPRLHDVTVDNVRHDERDALIGEPIEGEQLTARGWTGATPLWARYYEGGIVIWNSSAVDQTVTPDHLAGNSGSSAPHPSGTLYKRIDGTTNPFNTGANVDANFTVPAKSGVILLRR